jgi:hypothetical protein
MKSTRDTTSAGSGIPHKRLGAAWVDTEMVFTEPDGAALDPTYVSRHSTGWWPGRVYRGSACTT